MLSDFLFNQRGWLILVILALLIFSGALIFLLEPANSQNQTQTLIFFSINPGEGFQEISANLTRGGLIKSEVGFKIYSLVSGSAHLFKPGIYPLSPTFSGIKIASILVAGPQDIVAVIQEGETLVDIDRKLAELKVINSGELIAYNQRQDQSLEGYLFPDTYRFVPFSSAEVIVKRFLDNFEKKVGKINYRTLILASLVEKESFHSQDRLLVAGILEKRLKLGPLAFLGLKTWALASRRIEISIGFARALIK